MSSRRSLMCLLAAATVVVAFPRAQKDPLATEIARWASIVASDTRTDPLWIEARKSGEGALRQAEEALRHGRRLVALERLAAVSQQLGAALYVSERPAAERKELLAFEAEWKRVGGEMRDVVAPAGRTAESLATIRPALARALAELSISQARESYAAGLEYGRNTEPQYGLYYLGAAQAHRSFVEFARGLPTANAGRAPQLRSLRSEIDALQALLLAAYRPPASIDRHSEFIVASSALKEAREQDAAGHRYAALLRYLQAAQRTAMLRHAGPADMSDVRRRLADADSRLRDAGVDHTLGQFFVERANTALATDGGAAGDTTAAALAIDVLPRYLAALEPAPAAARTETARVTVTLVRWPFT